MTVSPRYLNRAPLSVQTLRHYLAFGILSSGKKIHCLVSLYSPISLCNCIAALYHHLSPTCSDKRVD